MLRRARMLTAKNMQMTLAVSRFNEIRSVFSCSPFGTSAAVMMTAEWNTECNFRIRRRKRCSCKSVVANWIQIYQIQSEWNVQIIKRAQASNNIQHEIERNHKKICCCDGKQNACKNKHSFEQFKRASRMERIPRSNRTAVRMFNSIAIVVGSFAVLFSLVSLHLQ